MRNRLSARGAAAALLSAVLVAGCGGSDDPDVEQAPSSGVVTGALHVVASEQLVDARSYGNGVSVCEVDALRGRFVVVTDADGKEVGRAHVPNQGRADKPPKPTVEQGGVPGTCTIAFSARIDGPKDAGPFRMQLEGTSESVTYRQDGRNQIEVRDLG